MPAAERASLQAPLSLEPDFLTPEEQSLLASVSKELFFVYANGADSVKRHDALLRYVRTKHLIARRAERFGIVNNRIFLADGQMVVPYLVGDAIVVQRVREGIVETVSVRPYPEGKILTDAALMEEAGITGSPVDLEEELFDFDTSRAVPVHVVRIGDFVEHLQNIHKSANRSEAIYVLRLLVARLSLFSFKKQLSAKNLQSEVHSLFKELVRFINSALSERPHLLVRILVRDIAAVVTRPKLIDRLWNYTIDLAEIHIRGSAVVNELRRSSHHALGGHTLKLARAYLTYLETGEEKELKEIGYEELSPADEKARMSEHPKRIVGRIISDLQELMGSSETVTRIRDWQKEYEDTLVRCEFGKSLAEEAAAAVEGMREGNRWVYSHHLRGVLSILQSRAAEIGKNRQERAFQDPGEEDMRGIGIRGSAFRGVAVFDKEDLDSIAREDLRGRDDADGVLLLLESPAPEFIPLVLSADALLTAKGGSTSHAAIAINGIQDRDYSAVMSATGLHVNARKHEALVVDREGNVRYKIRTGDIVSIHGMTGNVYVGTRKTI